MFPGGFGYQFAHFKFRKRQDETGILHYTSDIVQNWGEDGFISERVFLLQQRRETCRLRKSVL